MKRMKIWRFPAIAILLWCVVAAATSSCDDERVNPVTGSSPISVSLTVVATAADADDSSATVELGFAPSPDEFAIILTDRESGKIATWSSLADFDSDMLWRNGEYTLSALSGSIVSEGFDAPSFGGETTFVTNGTDRTDVALVCRLTKSMVDVSFSDSIERWFDAFDIILHSPGGGYVHYPSGAGGRGPVFLQPGRVSIAMAMTLRDGRSAIVDGPVIGTMDPSTLYHIAVTADRTPGSETMPTIRISYLANSSDDDFSLVVSDELFDASHPSIIPYGYDPASPVLLPEGESLDRPVGMTVTPSDPAHLWLTTRSVELMVSDWPAEIDLMEPGDFSLDALRSVGIDVTFESEKINVDFSELLPRIRFNGIESRVTFYLCATSANGEMSEPCQLTIIPEAVEITVVPVGNIVVGENRGHLLVVSPTGDIPANLSVEALGADRVWTPCGDLRFEEVTAGRYNVGFATPDGTDPLQVRVLYCGTVRAEFVIRRVQPPYNIEVDPYACSAVIAICPEDTAVRAMLTGAVTAYVNGQRGSITLRDPARGIVTVSGLSGDTNYSVALTLMENPVADDFSETVSFRTESATTLPNGDLEDFKRAIEYKKMASGGRYSQNYVEIFNQQNYRTFAVDAPTRWANTNAKTFCTAAQNHNTWYLQPSCQTVTDAATGSYAVRLTSVAWDTDGEPIADYLQESQPFVPYSRTLPQIRWRAAGKMFLGSYSFDPSTVSETIVDGIAFQSRPSALNGNYKFIPGASMPLDRGLARIEVLGRIDGEEQVIASGSLPLAPSTTYASFSVPLTYERFGVKATRLRVMLASTTAVGSIAEETGAIVTTPDFATSSATASELWVDNLSLSY
ncbi:MAG: DUF4493 domain-containing protein [Clostridium sp.]|nr:DUF4493 domain-containing protein [Clostridium sp.]